jgi:hypothetical protein
VPNHLHEVQGVMLIRGIWSGTAAMGLNHVRSRGCQVSMSPRQETRASLVVALSAGASLIVRCHTPTHSRMPDVAPYPVIVQVGF